MTDPKDRRFSHYWICDACAKERGGVWPDGHVATVADIPCKYCDDKNRVGPSAPYIDYDWPRESYAFNKKAKVMRD